MFKVLNRDGLLAITIWLIASAGTAQAELTLQDAERLALERDPMLAGLNAQALAYAEQAIADGQLPDPRLKFGLMNFPTDTFDRDQEPMTQVQLGVQQMFPSGDTLRHKSRRTLSMRDAKQASTNERRLKVMRETRYAWLETWYWLQAVDVVKQSQSLFDQLIEITRSRYAVGGQNQQDVIRAELELEMLRDKETNILSKEEKNRAMLVRWTGDDNQPLSDKLPELTTVADYNSLLTNLSKHPMLQAENAKVEASQQGVAIAKEAYKPKWMLDVTYGARAGDNMDGSDRADFASAMVLVDIPLFTDKRQDKRLVASQHRATAAMSDRDDRYLELKSMLDKTFAEWRRLNERAKRYQSTLVPQARENAAAALNAYQSDRGDFTMLMRARITELNTQLQSMRLQIDALKAQAGLLYIAGDIK